MNPRATADYPLVINKSIFPGALSADFSGAMSTYFLL